MANFGERMAAKKSEKKTASSTTERAPIAAGVGESKRFGGTYTRELAEGERDMTECTLNGHPIPDELRGVIAWEMTDQAREERETMLDATRPGWRDEPRVSVGREPVEKSVDKFRDGLADSVEPWEGGIDPLLEIKKKHGKPGERYRFLNESKIDRDGWRGWEAVKAKDEDGVERTVKLGRMIFAKMPEAKAKKRDRFMAEQAEQQMVSHQERHADILEQARRDGLLKVSDAGLERIARRRGQGGQDVGRVAVTGDARELNDPDFEMPER